MDSAYTKETFDINFPFCLEISNIPPELSKRYWTNIYRVRGKTIRVTSQWFDDHVSNSRALFGQYLFMKKLATKEEMGTLPELLSKVKTNKPAPQIRRIRTNATSKF